MAKAEGFMIDRFSLDKKLGLVNSRTNYAYRDEQVLTWAFEELAIAARFGVGLGSWPLRREGIRETALGVIGQKLDLVSWAIAQDRTQGSMDRAALRVVKTLLEFGTDEDKLNGKKVIETNSSVLRWRANHYDDARYVTW